MTEALLKYTIFLDKGRGLKRIAYSFMRNKSTPRVWPRFCSRTSPSYSICRRISGQSDVGGGGVTSQCLLRRHNFFLVCQQKNGIPRLVLVFLIKRERNWNKLCSCLRDFYVSNIFQKQLHNLFQFHQKSSKKTVTLLKNIGLAWHTQKKLKRASGTVWATWQKRCWNTLFF